MKQLSTDRKSLSRNNEAGMFVIILALTVFVFLVIAAFALEVGNLQLQHLRTQRAVDAAVVASSWLLETHQTQPALVQQRGLEILKNNLEQHGAQYNPAELVLEVLDANGQDALIPGNGAPRKVRASARIDSPLLLLRLVPFFQFDPHASAVAEAGDIRLVVSLLIDKSGSMGSNTYPNCCTNLYGGCNFQGFAPDDYYGQNKCFDDTLVPPDPNDPAYKLELTKQAAIGFINGFGESDRMAVISFSDNTNVEQGMAHMDQSTKTSTAAAINAIFPGGYTNIEQAIEEGINQINSQTDLSPNDFKAIILITDGAPTAGDDLACSGIPGPNPVWKRRGLQALVNADQARAQGIAVFAIGMGRTGIPYALEYPNGEGYDPDDVLFMSQSGGWNGIEWIVQSTFLARLAGDCKYLSKKPYPGGVPTPEPTPWYNDFPDCGGQIATNQESCTGGAGQIGPKDYFYQTPDAAELPGILAAIGASLKALMNK